MLQSVEYEQAAPQVNGVEQNAHLAAYESHGAQYLPQCGGADGQGPGVESGTQGFSSPSYLRQTASIDIKAPSSIEEREQLKAKNWTTSMAQDFNTRERETVAKRRSGDVLSAPAPRNGSEAEAYNSGNSIPRIVVIICGMGGDLSVARVIAVGPGSR